MPSCHFRCAGYDHSTTVVESSSRGVRNESTKSHDYLEAGFDDATAVLMLPEKYRKRLRTTNALERLNEEIRRCERVIRIFPNRESTMRLIGALMMEVDEKW